MAKVREIKNDDILHLKKRRLLYNLISNNPGLHLREIKRRADMPYSTLKYHLDHLTKKAIIEVRKQGRFLCYYKTNNIGIEEKKILRALRQPAMRKIILILFLDICCNLTELTKLIKYYTSLGTNKYDTFDRAPSTLIVHLKKLVEIGILERAEINGKIYYYIKEPDAMYRLLVQYGDSFFDVQISAIIRFLDIYTDKGLKQYNKEIDSRINCFYEIFPHPYHV